MNLPSELVRLINGGHCFALIGSGPSSELGYPSWKTLAETIASAMIASGSATDPDGYRATLEARRYPALFQQAEYDGGGRRNLVQQMAALLRPSRQRPGELYQILVRWPFACYLTTNWDDEIACHLEAIGCHYTTLQNSPEDFHHIRESASHLIIKLHSDLEHPNNAVITSSDYQALSFGPAGNSFRVKLRTIFDFFDVLIIGHSLEDPDIQIVLQTAKQTANQNRPIYLLATGANKIDIREFYQNYNIVLIPYDNIDNTHAQLRRMLLTADRFIQSRTKRIDLPVPMNTVERDAAVSLFLFRRLQVVQNDPAWTTAEYLGPLILHAAGLEVPPRHLTELLSIAPFQSMVSASDPSLLLTSIEITCRELQAHGLLQTVEPLALADKGRTLAQTLKSTRDLERSQAIGQFLSTLRHIFPTLSEKEAELSRMLIEECIVESFRRRGLAIAGSIFGSQSVGADDLTDLFASISTSAASFSNNNLQLAFTEAAHEFLTAPTEPQRNYLSSVSQGFFLFHMLGYDVSCARIRNDLFRSTAWFCDSSVLIPLLAHGSQNHEFALDFFRRLIAKGVRPFVTVNMAREVFQHLEWAVRFVKQNPASSPTFLAAALAKPGYKQNHFLDGYIRLSAEGRVSSFADYLGLVCKGEFSHASVMDRLNASGILVTSMHLMEGFRDEDMVEVSNLADVVKEDRASHMIYTSDEQVQAEAEVLYIIRQLRGGGYRMNVKYERVYFISESHVLNRVTDREYVTTWTPEKVYRYLLSLPGEQPDANLLQQCMLNESYLSGTSLIDKKRYLVFFDSVISTARLQFQEQKQQYLDEIESSATGLTLESQFESTPDLEKPLFVHRMSFHNIEAALKVAREATERAVEAERKVKRLEEEREHKWRSAGRARAAQLAAEERNRTDPKHVRKRERQLKRRKRGR